MVFKLVFNHCMDSIAFLLSRNKSKGKMKMTSKATNAVMCDYCDCNKEYCTCFKPVGIDMSELQRALDDAQLPGPRAYKFTRAMLYLTDIVLLLSIGMLLYGAYRGTWSYIEAILFSIVIGLLIANNHTDASDW